MISDEATKNYYIKHGEEFENPVFPTTLKNASDREANLKKVLAKESHRISVADTLEELAAKSGIDPKGLLKSVAEYNKACEAGRDSLFNKNPKYLRPIKQPKFYAFKGSIPGAYGSLGGIKINYKLEVVGEDCEPIPGLYAAGTDANDLYSGTYIYPLAGNTMGWAVNSGRMAGENAAEYVKSIE